MTNSDADLLRLAEKMRRSIPIKDRMYRLQWYKSCFVGEQAVHWLVEEGHAADAQDAVEIGNRMLLMGILHHVCHEHLFENAYLFYRFNLEEEEMERTGSSAGKKKKSKALLKVRQNPSWSLAKEVARIQRNLNKVEKSSENGIENLATALQQVGSDHTSVVDSLHALKFGVAGINRSLMSATSLLLLLTMIVIFASENSRFPIYMAGILCFFHLVEVYLYSKKLQGIPVPQYYTVHQQGIQVPERMVMMREPSLQETAMQRLPPVGEWEQRPVLMRINSSVAPMEVLNKDMNPVNLPFNGNEPIQFETPYFKGKILVYVAGLENSPDRIFSGKRRRLETIVQGRFKKEVSYNDVLTGQEWFRSLVNLPSIWFVNLVVGFLSSVSPTMKASGITSDRPRLLSKLASSSQVIVVSPDEQSAPDIRVPFDEDMSCVGPQLRTGEGMPIKAASRKRILSSSSTLKQHVFNTKDVYTFCFWQHSLDVATMQLNTGVGNFDLSKYLNSQPISVMAKTVQDEYLWRFELWHESLVVQQ